MSNEIKKQLTQVKINLIDLENFLGRKLEPEEHELAPLIFNKAVNDLTVLINSVQKNLLEVKSGFENLINKGI